MSIYGKLGVINTNLMANMAYMQMGKTNNLLNTHQNNMATLKKINVSADDPAGYLNATGMKISVNGMEMAVNNIGNADNMINIANDGATSIKDLLMEMRQKALESSDGTKTSAQRLAIQDQVAQYMNEISDTVGQTTWNGDLLLDGNASFNFQTGPEIADVTNLAIGLNFRLGLRQADTAQGLGAGDIYFSGVSVGAGGKPEVTNAANVIDADWTIEFTADNAYKVSYTSDAGVNHEYKDTYYLADTQQFSMRGISLNGLALASGITDAGFSEGDIITFETEATKTYDLFGTDWDVQDNDNYNDGITSMISATGTTGTTGLAEEGDLIEFEVKVTKGVALGSTASGTVAIRTRVDKGDGNGWGDWTDWEDEKNVSQGAALTVSFADSNHHATDLEIAFNTADVLTEGDVFTGKIQTDKDGDVYDDSVNVDGLTGSGGINLSTANGAVASLRKIDAAIDLVDSELGNMGAMTKRLDIKSSLLNGRKTQVGAAISRIEDADLIQESMDVAKLTILQQSTMSLLAQAQQMPRMVLGMLGLGG